LAQLLRAKIAQRQGDAAEFARAARAVRAADRAAGGDTGASELLAALPPPEPKSR
jgi:hypothetical protein